MEYHHVEIRKATVSKVRVVEVNNKNSVHCLTWSVERAKHWIETINLSFLSDKTLTRDSFKVQVHIDGIWMDYKD